MSGRVELKATDAAGDVGVAALAVHEPEIVTAEPATEDCPPSAEPVTPAPLRVTASVAQVSLSRVLSRSLPVTVRCETACRATATLAKRGAARIGSASGGTRLTVKVSAHARKALRKTRSVTLQVATSATTIDGRAGRAATTLRVQR